MLQLWSKPSTDVGINMEIVVVANQRISTPWLVINVHITCYCFNVPVSTNCVGNHPWISRFRSHLTHLKPIWQYYTFTHYCTCWHAFRLYQNLVHLAHRLSGIVCLQLFPGPESRKIWTANPDKRKVRFRTS